MDSPIVIRDYPYVHQAKPNSCGAACLLMVYKYFGLNELTEQEVFSSVVGSNSAGSFFPHCRTYRMVADAISRGFAATGFFSIATKDTILFCRDAKIELILLVRLRNTGCGHFGVVSNATNGQIYLLDPNATIKPIHIPFNQLDDRMATTGLRDDEIKISGTMVAIARHDDVTTSEVLCPGCKCLVPVIDKLLDFNEQIVCPYCDTVFRQF